MDTFTEKESKLILKLKDMPPQSILKISDPCPLHSVCTPLPLFRLYRIDDNSFEAEWNGHHSIGVRQVFRFEDAA